MRRHAAAVLATIPLLLTGCGGEALVASPSSTTPAPTPDATPDPRSSSSTPPTTTSATPGSASHPPPAPPSANVQDCFDGDCTLLTGPATIPLDAATFYYPSVQVTAISAASLTYRVVYPHGGEIQSTVGMGLGGAGFGFREFQAIRVGLALVDGTPALVLQPGALS